MDNQFISNINECSKRDQEGLISEKRRILAHCMNLECQNEQLKILIEKLHKIANQREDLFLKVQDPDTFSREVDQLYLKKSSIFDELNNARENSKSLEKTISNLKDKVVKIDDQLIS